MVGRDVSQFYARRWHQAGEVVFEVKDLITPAWPQQEISFSILRGEIVGVAGLVGAGRTELFRTLFGIDKPLGGQIRLGGQPLVVGGPADAIRSGMALVPEDRKLHGLVIEEAVKRNIGLAGLRRNRLPFGFLNQRKENEDTRQMIDKLRIKTPSPHQIVQ
jgi:ribose transport system ATP-binding protein